MSLIVATGLAAEARIAGKPDVETIIGAGRANQLAADLEAAIAAGATRILSFGVAGGLSPELRAGDLVLADGLRDGDVRRRCDPTWRSAMSRRLQRLPLGAGQGDALSASPERQDEGAVLCLAGEGDWRAASGARARFGTIDIVGADAPVVEAAGKAALFAASGAVAVDMESAIVARVAQRHNIPFAILRVIADPAGRSLPKSSLSAMGPDGEIDVVGLFVGLIADPGQLFALARLAADARRAFSVLKRARAALGGDFASLDGND
jgi:adenosylhomocysteine nucleosidase